MRLNECAMLIDGPGVRLVVDRGEGVPKTGGKTIHSMRIELDFHQIVACGS
jgi:hypothetical protein